MSRCPWCGAHNPREAPWCGQCLTRFDAAASPRAAIAAGADRESTGRVPAPAAAGDAFAPAGSAFPVVPPAPSSGEAHGAVVGVDTGVDTGAFVADGQTVRWRCPTCERINDLDAFVCATCGTSLGRGHHRALDIDWDLARRRAVLAPGLGHLAAGRTGTGGARLLLAGVWLLGALGLLLSGGTAALAPAVPLLAGVAVLWAGGVLDVARLARGRAEVLDTRVLLWVVVAVLVGVVLTLVARAAPVSL